MTTPERAAELFYKHHLGYTQAVALMIDMYGLTSGQAMNIIDQCHHWQRMKDLPKLKALIENS